MLYNNEGWKFFFFLTGICGGCPQRHSDCCICRGGKSWFFWQSLPIFILLDVLYFVFRSFSPPKFFFFHFSMVVNVFSESRTMWDLSADYVTLDHRRNLQSPSRKSVAHVPIAISIGVNPSGPGLVQVGRGSTYEAAAYGKLQLSST
jgi:hypothetical protein